MKKLLVGLLVLGCTSSYASNKVIHCTNSERIVFAAIDLVDGTANVTDISADTKDLKSNQINSLSGGIFEFRNPDSNQVKDSVSLIFNAVMMKAQVRHTSINKGKGIELDKCNN